MKLLITTQAVDQDDPVLGFFHRWIEEFAKRCEKVSVICLRKGRHSLPAHVSVYSLGKESGASRLKYIWNFYRYIWTLRHDYDAVFAHMNQEYVLLGWKLWRVLGKRIALWRNHKQGSILTRIAASVSHAVCYTSPEAYVAHYKNAVKMPIGIDTNVFKFDGETPAPGSILFLGRLDPVKRTEVFVDALKKLAAENVAFHADIYGDPTNPKSPHVAALKQQAAPLVAAGHLAFHPAVPNDQTTAIYGAHSVYVNLTPAGSFDKTIGEAMASGRVVVTANDVVRGAVLEELIVAQDSPENVARGIRFALALPKHTRAQVVNDARAWIEREHSLWLLAERLMRILTL